jgi:hypothetical protein
MVIADSHKVLTVLANVFEKFAFLRVQTAVVVIETRDSRIAAGTAQKVGGH